MAREEICVQKLGSLLLHTPVRPLLLVINPRFWKSDMLKIETIWSTGYQDILLTVSIVYRSQLPEKGFKRFFKLVLTFSLPLIYFPFHHSIPSCRRSGWVYKAYCLKRQELNDLTFAAIYLLAREACDIKGICLILCISLYAIIRLIGVPGRALTTKNIFQSLQFLLYLQVGMQRF